LACQKALAIEPNNEKGHYRLAKAQIAIKDFEIRRFEQFRGIDPQYDHVLNAISKSSKKVFKKPKQMTELIIIICCLHIVEAGVTFNNSFFDNSFVLV
jgi:hypothetical protein